MQNGTIADALASIGEPSASAAGEKFQSPFRFIQWSRASCGRGYSGCALVGETSFAQRVSSGASARFHAGDAARTIRQTHNTAIAMQIFKSLLVRMIEVVDGTGLAV